MKIAFITDGVTTPASRFRCEQFFEHFEGYGIRCTLKFGYGSDYNRLAFRRGASLYKIASRLKRGFLQLAAQDHDILFLQRPAIPHLALFESLLDHDKIVFDFDDNLQVGPDGTVSFWRRTAFERCTHLAHHIIAGNLFLAEQTLYPQKTSIIPTVIDTDRYIPNIKSSTSTIVLGWMGTAGNFPFLQVITPSLERILAKNPHVRLRIVSNQIFVPLKDHAQVDQVPWSAQREIELLQGFDIGLMPLVASPLTQGKCAFKMIQYMATGIPSIVSAVGANIEVFGEDTCGPGLLLSTNDWDEELQELIDNPIVRQDMGDIARCRAVENYSIAAVVPSYLSIFEKLMNK